MRSILVSLCLLGVNISATLQAQEWTRFRGPNGTGVSLSQKIPAKWTDKNQQWKVQLPGLGHSSPVVWGDKVFLLSANPQDATRYVLGYSAVDGRQLWVRTYASTAHHLHERSSYASCTPAVDSERVYVAWSTPEQTLLKAFDHDGNEEWSVDLGRWVSQHGFGTSPIVYGEMVILHDSQQADQLDPGVQPGESFMLAFDRRTGRELWRTPLVSKNVCYSVPFIFQPPSGRPELVCTSTGNGVFSLDPRTGEENWSIDVFQMRTVNSPIFAGGHIFGSTGSGAYSSNYIVAVKPGKQAEVAFELKNGADFKAPYVPCLIAKDNNVFLFYDRGFASCIDASSGKIHWFERTGGAFSGSPVMAGDRIYCIDEEGDVWVIAADPTKYRLLAKNALGEPSRSTPAISGDKMFLRTESHLICIAGEAAGG